jgi:23S rRNA (guanosine2251-2'-O)-methyltransferase
VEKELILICHNLRSCHNVGSLLRTADGLGLKEVYLTGYTPFPIKISDDRLPYIAEKLHKQIKKTALGAEESVKWIQNPDIFEVLESIRNKGYEIVALEQAENALDIQKISTTTKLALIVGREVEGIESEVLAKADITVFIPMFGVKESFNVVQAAAMALYHYRFEK